MFRYLRFSSRTANAASTVTNESASASGRASSRLSPDVWYSGNSPHGVHIRHPTGRSKPGEQYWRSSYPYGVKSTAVESRSSAGGRFVTARSISASSRRLRL